MILNITIEIADEPLEDGYPRERMALKYGEKDGDILGRIVAANEARFPGHRVDTSLVLGRTIAAAVRAVDG